LYWLSPSADRAALFAPPDATWLGAMTPKRWARRAVTRNAIRRQIYAVGENLDHPLSAGAHLVRLRSDFAPAQFPSACSDALKRAVRAELLQLFARGERPA
jgi:ribonuclease P protein component